jgi:hypothetical protein
MMNIESCPICNQPMSGRWREVGSWQERAPIRRVFAGWECASGCDQGPRAKEWHKEIRKRGQAQGIAGLF